MKRKLLVIGGIVGVMLIIASVVIFVRGNKVTNDAASSNSIINISNLGKDTSDSQSYWTPGAHNFAKGEGGYYYTVMNNMEMYLMFFDVTTHSSIPVCGKADCLHNSSSCNAYLSTEYLSSAYYYDGHVYMIKRNNGMGVLTRISADGSIREEVAELFPNAGVTSIALVFHADYVYAYDHLGHTGSTTEATEVIKKISLKNKTTEVIYEHTGVGDCISGAKSFGDKLFFNVFNYQLDKTTLHQTINSQLYAYDYNTGNTETVSDDRVCDYFVDVDSNVIYYFVMGEGLYKCSLDEKNPSLIFPVSETMVFCTLSYDGKYLYLSNGGMGSVSDAGSKIDKIIYVVDTAGNIINTIKCDKNTFFYFGDSNYMFASMGNSYVYMDKSDIANTAEWKKLGN